MQLENPDLEKVVLSAMIADVHAYFALSDRLQVDAFTTQIHRALYREIGKMAAQEGRVSHRLLSHRLQDSHEDIGPYVGALVALSQDADDLAHAEDYAETLVDLHMRRAAEAAIEEARKALARVDRSPEPALIRLSEKMAELTQLGDGSRRQSLSQAVGSVIEYAGNAAKGIRTGIGWPLRGLQELIGDALPGDLILVGGAPGAGKTALAMQCATEIARTRSVAFFEMEMSNMGVVERWFSGAADVPLQTVHRGVDEKQYNRMVETAAQYQDRRFWLWDRKFTVPQIRARAMAQKKTMGLDLIVVDHADLIPRETKYRLRGFERTNENAEDLKELAKDLGCVILLLCHFTKHARERDDPTPQMEDFAGGGIEKHADIMIATLNRYAWLKANPPRIKTQKAQDKYEAELLEHQGKVEVHRLKHRRAEMRAIRSFEWTGSRTLLIDFSTPNLDLFNQVGSVNENIQKTDGL